MAKRSRNGNGFMNDLTNGLIVGTIGGIVLMQVLHIGACNPLSGIMDGDVNFDCLNPIEWIPGSELP